MSDEPAFSQQHHRLLIGVLGLALPVLIYGVAGWLVTPDLDRWQLLPSMSAYAYTGSGVVFSAVLFALALFLVTYRGYALVDRVIGRIAGLAACGVAFCPTAPPGDLKPAVWWSDDVRTAHYVSAVVLFVCFILFAGWLFRKSSEEKTRRPADKRRRDDVCLGCAIVMTVCVLWAGSSKFTGIDIFVPEAIAVIAFAVSWLAKSCTVPGLRDAAS